MILGPGLGAIATRYLFAEWMSCISYNSKDTIRRLPRYLEVIRQLRSTRVARVHGNEDAAVTVALDRVSHEDKRFLSRAQGVQDRQYLISRSP